MIKENLSTLKIHKLSQAQYDRELAAGRIDENALYLTPDDEGGSIAEHNSALDAHSNMGWLTSEDVATSDPTPLDADTLDGYDASYFDEQIDELREIVNRDNLSITSISVTEASDGTVTITSILDNDDVETVVIIADANGNPSALTYNGIPIPITWTEADA